MANLAVRLFGLHLIRTKEPVPVAALVEAVTALGSPEGSVLDAIKLLIALGATGLSWVSEHASAKPPHTTAARPIVKRLVTASSPLLMAQMRNHQIGTIAEGQLLSGNQADLRLSRFAPAISSTQTAEAAGVTKKA